VSAHNRLLVASVFLFTQAACPLSLEDRPCPCVDGFECCEGQCVEPGLCTPHV
jgi:hypothetical protein